MKKENLSTGQSLVIIALLMLGMLAFLGLILDGGAAYLARRRSQDASDSAAFASVRVLALRTSNGITVENQISSTINSYAMANRIAGISDVTAAYIDANGNNICTLPCGGVPTSPLATGIRVTTTLRFQPYFISVMLGNNPIPIQSVAAAQSGRPSVGALLAPMTLKYPCMYDPNNPSSCGLQYNVSYQLMGDPTTPGGFQWVDWSGGASANDIVNYLKLKWTGPLVMADRANIYINPATPRPTPSPWIPSGPGVQPNNNIQDALDCWLDLNKSGCWQGPPDWGPKPSDNKWTVPVFNATNGTGSGAEYHVVMFAEFQLQGYWFANNQCNWIGKLPSQHCNEISDLPPPLATCAQTQDPNGPPGEKMKCIMGQFLREVDNLQIAPGSCNTSVFDICGFGLSQ